MALRLLGGRSGGAVDRERAKARPVDRPIGREQGLMNTEAKQQQQVEKPARSEDRPERFTAQAARPGVAVRVSVLADRNDEEEKEAGYGHGV
jgi:hypothetical protein